MPARTRRAGLILALALLAGPAACSDADPGADSPAAPPAPTTSGTATSSELPVVLRTALDGEPARARTPRQLAWQLQVAEATIADTTTAPDVVAAAGRVQQVAYRVLGARPAWDDAVRRILPAELHRRVAANVASRREFRSMHGTLATELPAWRIVPPVPAGELREIYLAAERRFGVDWEYLAAINLVETGMGRIRGTSVAGAQGPMQFIPSTWELYGRGDIDDPRDAVMAAARYLEARGFTEPRGRGIDDALYSYNNHPAYVRGVRLLAEQMQARPRAYLGYHAWEVYYLTARGDVLLPVGYEHTRPVAVDRYLADATAGVSG